MSSIDCDPAEVSAAIEEFRYRTAPALLDVTGLCSAQFLVDRGTGHCVAVATWEGMDIMRSTRSRVAALRTDLATVTHAQVRGVEEYMLNFSTVREGDNMSLIEREVTLWNERDQAGWLALADLNKLEITAPGGVQLSGHEAADALWDTWNDAFPDNRLTTVNIHADERGGVFEGRFAGTHSGHLRGAAGDVGPTSGWWTPGSPSCTSATTARSPARISTTTRPICWPSWVCRRAPGGDGLSRRPGGQLRRSWISDTTSRMVERSSRDRASETSRAASGTVRSISR